MEFLSGLAAKVRQQDELHADPILPTISKHPVTLLVIQNDNYDWRAIFKGRCLSDGRAIVVAQVGWDEIHVTADSPSMSSDTPVVVHVQHGKTIKPDFVLIRNEVRGVTNLQDFRNTLFGLMYAGIPSVNSLQSIYNFLERPLIQAELNKIQRKLGVDNFPLIPQSYFATYSSMMYGGKFPAVLKVGHAGYGKMRVSNHHDWEDVRTVVAMADGKYCTAEPYIEGEYDIRIQKIGGKYYRVYRRDDISGTWKTNTGCSIIKQMELIPRYKLWADEASKMFGGLDICTVDVIYERETGKEYILEVNGTSSGLCPDYETIDNEHIHGLVIQKMNSYLCTDDD